MGFMLLAGMGLFALFWFNSTHTLPGMKAFLYPNMIVVASWALIASAWFVVKLLKKRRQARLGQ